MPTIKLCTAPIRSLILVVFLASGCASNTRYIDHAEQTQSATTLQISSQDETLSATVSHLIIPNGPGSWLKDARWDEYVLFLENQSSTPVSITSIRLVDSRGVYLSQGNNHKALELTSQELMEEYKDIGISVGIGIAPAVVGGVALAGGSLGAAAGAAALAPVALIAAPAYYFTKKYKDQKDEESIDREFRKRQLSTLTFASKASVSGSVFFPIVPSPRSLVLEYRLGNTFRTLTVPLDQLSGLHVVPVQDHAEEP